MQILLKQISKHFHIDPSEIDVNSIDFGKQKKPNVNRLMIKSKYYLLKEYEITVPVNESGFTPCQIEKFTLTTLKKGGCLVPTVVWESKKDNALLLNWCGNHTLDVVAQNVSISHLSTLSDTILTVFNRVEEVFRVNEPQFEPFIFQFDAKENLQYLLNQGRKSIEYLTSLSKKSLTSNQITQLDTAWSSVSTRLLNAKLTLGSLDYQARNIVIDQLPYFIDFASVGWDWQERRLVQYLNSIGAYQGGGNFVSLLTRNVVERYAELVANHREDYSITDISACVDGHHLLFYLTVIHRILKSVARPEDPESQILIKAWGDPLLRLQSAISLIVDVNLSDDQHIMFIRRMIRQFATDSPQIKI